MLSQTEIHALMRTIEQAYRCRICIVDGNKNPLFCSNFPDFDTVHLAPFCNWIKKHVHDGLCREFDYLAVSKHSDSVKDAFYKICPAGCMEIVGSVNVPGMRRFQLFAGVFQARKDLPENAMICPNRITTPYKTQDFRALSDAEFASLPVLMNMLTREMTELFKSQLETQEESDPREIIEDCINANFRQNISLSDLAAKLGWSDSHTTVRIRKMFGKTFTRLLTERRLENAKWLLRNKSLFTISKIALVSGFRSTPYFHRVFLRAEGVTPSEFRRKAGKTRGA